MNKIIAVGIVVAVFCIACATVWEWQSCSNDGGKLVRGIFWFECVR